MLPVPNVGSPLRIGLNGTPDTEVKLRLLVWLIAMPVAPAGLAVVGEKAATTAVRVTVADKATAGRQ